MGQTVMTHMTEILQSIKGSKRKECMMTEHKYRKITVKYMVS